MISVSESILNLLSTPRAEGAIEVLTIQSEVR